eukprot:1894406-Amphidinium_carterae.1
MSSGSTFQLVSYVCTAVHVSAGSKSSMPSDVGRWYKRMTSICCQYYLFLLHSALCESNCQHASDMRLVSNQAIAWILPTVMSSLTALEGRRQSTYRTHWLRIHEQT